MLDESNRLLGLHLPGTCKWLVDKIVALLDGKNNSRIAVLHGDAGVGKSVFAAFLASVLQSKNRLIASFHCKADDATRNNGKTLLCFIAYSLCQWNPTIAKYLLQIVQQDKNPPNPNEYKPILSRSYSAIFSAIILAPLKLFESELDGAPIESGAMVLDAFDECGALGKRNELLDIFAVESQKLPTFIKIFITSRHENDIVTKFAPVNPTTLTISQEENQQDTAFYIEAQLKQLKVYTPEKATQFQENSKGLFIWLRVAFQELEKQDAAARESYIPPGNIHDFYCITFKRIFSSVNKTSTKLIFLQKVLGAVVLSYRPLSSGSMAALLNIEEPEVVDCIHILGTVLQFTEYVHTTDKASIHASNIRVLHKSVTDFLTSSDGDINPQFSFKKNSILARQTHEFLATGSMNLLAFQLSQKLTIYLNRIGTSNLSFVSERRKVFDAIFNEDINYASLYWAEHVNESDVSNSTAKVN
ncbi:hypothetical protein HK100_003993 [Physocladia obscura]|uniref:Nephrocystin 3-like N-terminal domain-containing protein n=1 Tax=Physocladia obscura TaxID=109957 RepID=A0AAD5STE4_9FUNG|nr:hypothetical protein HK100_003993 [Physocladia obscura]